MLINGESYKIVVGFDAPSDPQEESIIHHTMMDGSTETIDFRSRLTSIANFTVVQLTKQQFIDLTEYILANVGTKVLFQTENNHENIFVNTLGGNTYYVYPLKAEALQEEDFSVTRELFTLKIECALAGGDSDEIPNPPGTSLIDIFVELDTLNGATRDDTAPVSPEYGDRWLDTDDNKLYIFDLDTDDWLFLYDVVADDVTIGLKDGYIRLSTFSTIETNDDGNKYVAGLINYKSVQLPGQNIDISKGATIARKDGFNFSISNNERFWKFVIDNNIALFNIACTCYVYSEGTKKKIITGTNQTNSFTYTDYKFKIEPFLLNFRENFPSNVIGDDPAVSGERYDNINVNMLGKAPFKTFGEHSFAALQNISTNKDQVALAAAVPPTVPTTAMEQVSIFAKINQLNTLQIFIPKTTSAEADINYKITTAQISQLQNNHVVKIVLDDIPSSENVGVSRKIDSVSNADANWIIITLFEAFPTPPVVSSGVAPKTNNSQYIYLIGASYQFQIDDLPAGGFGSYDINGNIIDTITLYSIDKGNNRDLVPIPSTDFSENADGNIVALSVETATDTTSTETYQTTSDVTPKVITKTFGYCFDRDLSAANINATLGTTFTNVFSRLNGGSGFARLPIVYYDDTINISDLDFVTISPSSNIGIYNAEYILEKPNGVDLTSDDQFVNNSVFHIFSFPINHANDTLFITNDNVRLGLNFFTRNFVKMNGSRPNSVETFTIPIGFSITVRFRTQAGTYINNSDWKKDVNSSMTDLKPDISVDTTTYHKQWGLWVNNMPNGVDGGFSVNPTPLEDWYNPNTSSTLFIVQESAVGTQLEGTAGGEDQKDLWQGRALWLGGTTTQNGLYIVQLEGNNFVYRKAAVQPVLGDIIQESTFDLNGVAYGTKGAVITNSLYEITQVTPYIVRTYIPGQSLYHTQKLRGRDLWDLNLASLIGGETPLWSSVASMEIMISYNDFETNGATRDITNNPNLLASIYPHFVTETTFIEAPTIFFFKEMELVEIPLFSEVQGEESYTLAKDIVPAILSQSSLAGRYDTASVTNIFTGDAIRNLFSFRRQFTSAQNIEAMLLDLMRNLWTVAIINEEDKLEFKKLEATTGSPVFDFDESNIIDNSITEINFRDMREIYQKFRFNFDYFIPSEFSKAINKWNDTQFIDQRNGDAELKTLIKQWSQIYNMSNELVYELMYHYKGTTLPSQLVNWIVNFFVANSWTFSFRTPMNNVYDGDMIKLMDVVSVTTYFHTGTVTVNGFVVGINPNLYEGDVQLEIYVVDPPGKYGVICNPFNDALDVGTRDISGWTEANGKQNDAGNVAVDRSAYGIKDAGNVATRDLKC